MAIFFTWSQNSVPCRVGVHRTALFWVSVINRLASHFELLVWKQLKIAKQSGQAGIGHLRAERCSRTSPRSVWLLITKATCWCTAANRICVQLSWQYLTYRHLHHTHTHSTAHTAQHTAQYTHSSSSALKLAHLHKSVQRQVNGPLGMISIKVPFNARVNDGPALLLHLGGFFRGHALEANGIQLGVHHWPDLGSHAGGRYVCV